MAGSPAKRKRYEELQEKIEDLTRENAELLEKLSVWAPEALNQDRPPPQEQYDAKVPAKVLEMGRNGMDEAQWVAAFGIGVDTWDQWVLQHVELQKATKQAHAFKGAYWSAEMDRAIKENNTRFPINVAREKINSPLRQQGGDLGDASKLVVVDLTHARCPHCLKELNQSET